MIADFYYVDSFYHSKGDVSDFLGMGSFIFEITSPNSIFQSEPKYLNTRQSYERWKGAVIKIFTKKPAV